MNKVGNHKTHLDIEENRLYSMTFRMRYERDFLKQLIYMYIRLFPIITIVEGKVLSLKEMFLMSGACATQCQYPLCLTFKKSLVFVS